MTGKVPATTVEVDTDLRDRLLAEARREGRSVGQLIEIMLAERERAQRFASLRAAIAATGRPDRDSWRAETAAYEQTEQDGLDGREPALASGRSTS